MPARQVLTPMPERLDAAAQEVEDTALALKLARQRRDQLVRESVDDGHLSQRATAAAARITVPRVSAILAEPDEDDDDA